VRVEDTNFLSISRRPAPKYLEPRTVTTVNITCTHTHAHTERRERAVESSALVRQSKRILLEHAAALKALAPSRSAVETSESNSQISTTPAQIKHGSALYRDRFILARCCEAHNDRSKLRLFLWFSGAFTRNTPLFTQLSMGCHTYRSSSKALTCAVSASFSRATISGPTYARRGPGLVSIGERAQQEQGRDIHFLGFRMNVLPLLQDHIVHRMASYAYHIMTRRCLS
jgi:hypothetical protein